VTPLSSKQRLRRGFHRIGIAAATLCMLPPVFGVVEGLLGEGVFTYRLDAFVNWAVLAIFAYVSGLAIGWAAGGFVND
jgi:hypothetical protein